MARRDNTASESESRLKPPPRRSRTRELEDLEEDASSIRPATELDCQPSPAQPLKAASDLVKRKVFCVNNASCRTTCEDA